ncbi:Lrp/AsnC family transcriptional regulator [uncultured Erythrobacter sp.]|uniref:Lrp/AsnC family transcriptional regulator n=1 Tax=uncultured Erythrobacter sp. TaxID=263913 RepID=UPI00263422BD|nr:Lrp/AsnC family transcriptional regulator [uncultured Erythrobacter sp.]
MKDFTEHFDGNDRAILKALQRDATISLEALAETLSLSTNACWRRVKKLEASGVIERRVALVSPEAVGLNVTVFVSVKTDNHSAEWLTRFADATSRVAEVVEFYRMAGDVDYLLKLLVRDVADYDRVYKKLIAAASLADVSASFAMERIKYETAVPIT